MFANMYKLDNITAFVDFNGYQIDGAVTEVMDPTPIDEKFRAFGWHVSVIDGHELESIEKAVSEAGSCGRPAAIICNTVKGKGVSFMENQLGWHGVAPDDAQYKQAMEELEAQYV